MAVPLPPEVRASLLRRFEELQAKYSGLSPALTVNDPNVDFLLEVRQGLPFDLSLYLDGDELHINAGSFWVEWFPCERQDVQDAYSKLLRGY